MGNSTIGTVSPERLLVTIDGRARLRVQGRGRGLLRVGSLRRWVWGVFDETFVVAPPPTSNRVVVTLLGLGGRTHVSVPCDPLVQLHAPSVLVNSTRLEVNVPVARARGLVAHRISVPRIVPVTSATVESACLETEAIE